MQAITATEVRYIKLGEKGSWTPLCVERQELRLDFRAVPHGVCVARDWERAKEIYRAEGRKNAPASRFVTELREFYEQGSDCLWITFHDDRLWWCFAEPEVSSVESEAVYQGARMRKTRTPWSCTNINGTVLRQRMLGSRLTRVASYQGTICKVPDVAYLLRRLNGEEGQLLGEAASARSAMVGIAHQMIRDLDQDDFETMTDLIFTRGGWERISSLGGNMKTVDLALVNPTTDERAAVQVKSRANVAVFEDSIARMTAEGHDHIFFVCHTPLGAFAIPERKSLADPKVHVWAGPQLAEKALSAGLFDWLVERSG